MTITKKQIDEIQRILLTTHAECFKNESRYRHFMWGCFPQDALQDIKKMDHYIPVENYGMKDLARKGEIGCVSNLRIAESVFGGDCQTWLECECGVLPEVKWFKLKD